MYERTYKIERFLADHSGKLKPPVLFNMLSDIMERNANSYGAGATFHLSQNLAWVLTEYQIEFNAWPKSDEVVSIGTLPYSFKKMYGFRIYHGKDAEGNVLFIGKGKFVLIDIKTKDLVKPSQDILNLFTDAKKEPQILPFEKWHLKGDHLLLRNHTTISHDFIDINGHLNNAHSVTLAHKVLDPVYIKDAQIKALYVRYRKEAFKDESVTVNLYKESDNEFGVIIKREDTIISELLIKV